MITLTLDPVLAGALLTLLLTFGALALHAMGRARSLRRRLRAALEREHVTTVEALAMERVMERCPQCAAYLGSPTPPPRPRRGASA